MRIAACASVLLVCSALAMGATSAEFVMNPYSTITGMLTYDLVFTTTGADWLNARIELTLTSGAIWQHPTDDEEFPQSGLWPTAPTLEWDSFLAAPPSYAVPGFADQAGDGWTSTSVYRSWFDVVTTGPGTFVAARITVDKDAVGTYTGIVFDTLTAGVGEPFSGSLPTLFLQGDADLDNSADGGDYLTWQANAGTAGPHSWSTADFNRDGVVDGGDYLIWQANAGSTLGPTPEPASLAVLLISAPLLLRRRR